MHSGKPVPPQALRARQASQNILERKSPLCSVPSGLPGCRSLGRVAPPSLSRSLMTLRATLCRHRVRTQSLGDLPALEQRVLWQGAPLTRPRCLIWSENSSTSLDRAPNVAREGSWLTQEGGCKSLPLEGGKENLRHSAPKIYFCRLTEVAKCESGEGGAAEAPWT